MNIVLKSKARKNEFDIIFELLFKAKSIEEKGQYVDCRDFLKEVIEIFSSMDEKSIIIDFEIVINLYQKINDIRKSIDNKISKITKNSFDVNSDLSALKYWHDIIKYCLQINKYLSNSFEGNIKDYEPNINDNINNNYGDYYTYEIYWYDNYRSMCFMKEFYDTSFKQLNIFYNKLKDNGVKDIYVYKMLHKSELINLE
jgi:hypothetical protein